MKTGIKICNNVLFIFLFSVLFHSCIKDTINDIQNIKGVTGNPFLSVPLVNDHMGVKEIYSLSAKKGTVTEASDKFLTIVYKATDVLAQKQFVTLPTIAFGYDLTLDAGMISQFNAIGNYSNSFSNYAVILPNNKERFKKISLKSGSFNVYLSSDFKHNATIVMTYPTVTRSGKPLVDTIHLNYNGSSPVVLNRYVDISGYDIDLSNGGLSYNVVPYLYQITISKIPGNPVSVNDHLQIKEEINFDQYSFIQGYLGKFDVLVSSTDQSLDIFENQADGNIYIKDPKIRVNIEDGIGLPITARISNVRIKTGKGDIFPVNVQKFKDTFTFDYPRLDQIGQIIESGFVIDKTNSNIDTVMSRGPKHLYYDITFTANYNEDEEQDNFLLDRNIFNTNYTAELPLEIKIINYDIHSVDSLALPSPGDNFTIDWVKFSGYYENTFPLGETVQFYFCRDSMINAVDSFVVLDSLYAKPVFVPPAPIDVNGTRLDKTVITDEIVMDGARYNRLQQLCNKSRFVIHLRTSDFNGLQPYVKFYSDEGLSFKIGAELKGKYKFKSQ